MNPVTRRAAGGGMVGAFVAAATDTAAALPAYSVRRLVDRPIITPGMDARMGSNIEGPSLIRTPSWLPGRLGRYYLYFADHKGEYIRLAYANQIAGPWTVHAPGSLQLDQTGLPTRRLEPTPEQLARLEAASMPDRAPRGAVGIPTPLDDAVVPHIASPDVHLDAAKRQIVMYFHGLTGFGVQVTKVATSVDGINFSVRSELLGPPYMRAFDHGGWRYALTMPGQLLRSRDGLTGFERGPRLFPDNQRHTAVLRRAHTLHVFWTRVGDAPERILASTIDLRGEWRQWQASEPIEVLRAQRPWEGSELPVARSYRSATFEPVNQLRDPAIYEERGRIFLLYAVKGEGGIGVVELRIRA